MFPVRSVSFCSVPLDEKSAWLFAHVPGFSNSRHVRRRYSYHGKLHRRSRIELMSGWGSARSFAGVQDITEWNEMERNGTESMNLWINLWKRKLFLRATVWLSTEGLLDLRNGEVLEKPQYFQNEQTFRGEMWLNRHTHSATHPRQSFFNEVPQAGLELVIFRVLGRCSTNYTRTYMCIPLMYGMHELSNCEWQMSNPALLWKSLKYLEQLYYG